MLPTRERHIGERLQIPVGGKFPVRAAGLRVDSAAKPAEGGVGVDRYHAVLPAQFGEDRPDARGDGGFPDAAFAEHADLVVAVQR